MGPPPPRLGFGEDDHYMPEFLKEDLDVKNDVNDISLATLETQDLESSGHARRISPQ